jgi:(p)ppGpp synthase/HD superfamily hydrolase
MAGILGVTADRVPTFVRDRPLTFAALSFASRAHGRDRREADGAPFILHPLEVASLLSACDCRDEVTAAAVLHDTLEATDATGAEIELRFGAAIARLVCCVTEDDRIEDAEERKSALREQVAACDCEAPLIFAADKLSKVRELRIRLHAEPALAGRREGQGKLEHYWRSLGMLERELGGHPLVHQLRFELEAMRDLPPGATSRAALERAVPSELDMSSREM